MSKMKKILTLAVMMIFAICMTLTASAEEKVTATINGLQIGDEIRYGKFVELDANKNAYVLTPLGQTAVKTTGAVNSGFTSDEILGMFVGKDLERKDADLLSLLTWFENNQKGDIDTVACTSGDSVSFDITAGVYACKVINGPNSADIMYSPLLIVSAELDYDENGNLVGVKADTDTTVTAKKTTTGVQKDILNGTVDHDKNNKPINSFSLGDTVQYQLTIDVPAFGENTINHTMYVYDVFPEGITYDKGSVKYAVVKEATDEKNMKEPDGIYARLFEESVEGLTKIPENAAFALIFDYDSLGSLYTGEAPTPLAGGEKIYVQYTGTVNEDAFAGQTPNPNDVTYVHPQSPTYGTNYDPTNPPPEFEHPGATEEEKDRGYKKDTDTESVYTYGFYIVKNDAEKDPKKMKRLEGAEFKLYTKNDANAYEEVLLDGKEVVFTTNADGIGGVAGLAAGTYYIKETKAPAGYKLPSDAEAYTEVKTNYLYSEYVTTTTTISSWSTKTERTYGELTEDLKKDGKVQAMKNGQYVFLDVKTNAFVYSDRQDPIEGCVPAYVVSEETNSYGTPEDPNVSTKKTVDKDIIYGDSELGGAAEDIAHKVPGFKVVNTKLGALPSTGGVGTVIFSVVGSIGMLAAVAIFFENRRRVRR